MKKFFTLAALAAMTLCANAQTETWSLTGALPADFNGKQAADAEGFLTIKDGSAYIYGETENVKITYVSSPNGNSAESEKDSDLDECSAGTKSWVDLKANGSGNQVWDETFAHCIMGRGNPDITRSYWVEDTDGGSADRVTETFYEPGCGALPVLGTYIELEVANDGAMEAILMVWRPNNPLYIIDEATKEPLAASGITYEGWFNNNTTEKISSRTLADDYLPHYNKISHMEDDGEGGQKEVVDRLADPNKQLAASFKFDLKAGKYMIISPKSQIGLYGYNFTKGTNSISNIEAASTVNTPVYNLAGQKVNDSYKGIVIKNGKKVLVK